MTADPRQRVLGAIGKTPLIDLSRIAPAGSARLVAKLESANPTGSMKDRMALALVCARLRSRDHRRPVHSVSTAHSIHGTAHGLRQHNRGVHVVAVEPAESAVLSGKPSGSHKIEGIGIGFVPPLWKPDDVDEIQTVTTEEAKAMARRLAREEAVFAGTSSGANIVAALRLAQRLGPQATVATIIVDSGLRYLSTDVFRP
jgi:cysteine synthase